MIRPVYWPRSGWEEQFRIMAERGDDRLLKETATNLTRWDADEWEWTSNDQRAAVPDPGPLPL
jgi:antitoxin MazE